jgi:hypothetical protein
VALHGLILIGTGLANKIMFTGWHGSCLCQQFFSENILLTHGDDMIF